MARPRNEDRPIRKIFSIPESLAVKLELYCKDPLTGRHFTDHRSQSKLVERLLREFFNSIGKESAE